MLLLSFKAVSEHLGVQNPLCKAAEIAGALYPGTNPQLLPQGSLTDRPPHPRVLSSAIQHGGQPLHAEGSRLSLAGEVGIHAAEAEALCVFAGVQQSHPDVWNRWGSLVAGTPLIGCGVMCSEEWA